LSLAGPSYNIRGRGYARSIKDFENIVLVASDSGTPIRIKDVGQVVLGPDIRRGLLISMAKGGRFRDRCHEAGQNALDVINRVKAKIKEIEPGLPSGIKVIPVYDRSDLILRSIDN